MESNSLVIAITGGIGTGKTTVSKMIAECGHPVISTDEQAKIIMQSDEKVRLKLLEAFGAETFGSDGKLNSKYISEKVFGNTKEHDKALLKLNSIVHPPVIDFMIEHVQQLEDKGSPLIFVESALVYEAELDDGFDFIIVVDSTKENIQQRITQKSNLTKEELAARMKSQIPNDEKKQLADFVIDNNSTLEDLKKSVDFVLDIIKGI